MQEKSSRAFPIFFGFTLCILAMCIIAFTGLFAIKQHEEITRELYHANGVHISLMQSQRQFDAAQIAMLRFWETNEQKFAELAMQSLAEATHETTHETMSRWEEYKRHIHDLAMMYEKFAAYCNECVKLGGILARNRADWASKRLELLALLEQMDLTLEALQRENSSDAENQQQKVWLLRETVYRIAALQQSLDSPDERHAAMIREKIDEEDINIKTLLDKFAQIVVSAEVKQVLAKTTEQYAMLLEQTRELTKLYEEQRRIREELNVITDDIVTMSEKLLVLHDERSNRTEHEMILLANRLRIILIAVSVVAVVFVIVVCFVVGLLVNRRVESGAVPSYSDGMPISAPSGDMRIVADRLQEVVNLLRK